MKIKTFAASDMRQAMRAIREQLGPDAVILATERTTDGVLLTAATDFDPAAPPAAAAGRNSTAPPQRRAGIADSADAAMSEELRVLRRLLETQMAQLAWNEYSRREPVLAELHREFSAAGIHEKLLQQALHNMPAGMPHGAARNLLQLRIADRLRSIGDRWPDFGGRLVLLGASGAGKSTAAFRLAARWVQRHGNQDIAMVTADQQHFGATEQFAAHARLLGIPSYAIATPTELSSLLDTLRARRLVIVDTAGLGGDAANELSGWRDVSAARSDVEFVFVASASAHAETVARVLQNPCAPAWSAALITKLDENERIGALLATLAQLDVPLSYVTRGRRWLQDLRPARSAELMARALVSDEVSASNQAEVA